MYEGYSLQTVHQAPGMIQCSRYPGGGYCLSPPSASEKAGSKMDTLPLQMFRGQGLRKPGTCPLSCLSPRTFSSQVKGWGSPAAASTRPPQPSLLLARVSVFQFIWEALGFAMNRPPVEDRGFLCQVKLGWL